jgi:hypothetical protein
MVLKGKNADMATFHFQNKMFVFPIPFTIASKKKQIPRRKLNKGCE